MDGKWKEGSSQDYFISQAYDRIQDIVVGGRKWGFQWIMESENPTISITSCFESVNQ